MTVKEAKEILEKEGCFIITKLYGSIDYVKFQPWEKANVKEAIAFLGKNGYRVQTDVYKAGERNTRLIEEYNMRKNDARHGRKEEESAQITNEPIDGTRLNDSAKLFNDALLDEQAKKIKELEATVENREEEIDILNDTMSRRIKDIHDLKQTVKSDNAIIGQYEEKVKELGKQIAHLNEVIGKRNAEIKDLKIDLEEKEDLLECYRLSDKNKEDMISGLKKMNEKYRHQLADATIAKVDKQALKSAESALVYKDTVIDKQKQDIEGLRKEIERLKKNVLNATGVLVNSISKESAAHKYMEYTEETNKGYVMDVCEQQKKLVEYVAELMDEIPKWVNFCSEWKEAENSINNMSPEEFDKLFYKMF